MEIIEYLIYGCPNFTNSKIESKSKKRQEILISSSIRIIPGGSLRGVTVKALDCGSKENNFETQSRYYFLFRTNTLGKGTNPFRLQAMG